MSKQTIENNMVASAITFVVIDLAFQSALFKNLSEDELLEVSDIFLEELVHVTGYNSKNNVTRLKFNLFNRLKPKVTYINKEQYSGKCLKVADELLAFSRPIIELLVDSPNMFLVTKVMECKVNLHMDAEAISNLTMLIATLGEYELDSLGTILTEILVFNDRDWLNMLEETELITQDVLTVAEEPSLLYTSEFVVTLVSVLNKMKWVTNELTIWEVLLFMNLKCEMYKYVDLIAKGEITSKDKNKLMRFAIEGTRNSTWNELYCDTPMYKELQRFYLGG